MAQAMGVSADVCGASLNDTGVKWGMAEHGG